MSAAWVLLFALAAPVDDGARATRFAAAVEAARHASSTLECEAAARGFEALLDDTFDSADVRFNAGNAWLAAGRVGHAIAQYESAARARPRDVAIAANLGLARQRAGIAAPAAEPLDSIVFWQRWLSYREKATLALVWLGVGFLALCVASWTASRGWRRVGLVLLGLLAVFSVALVRDVIEHEFTSRAIVAAPGVIARKGAADEFAPAFNEALPEGTPVRVLESRPEWARIELDGGLDGWVRSSAIALIGPR